MLRGHLSSISKHGGKLTSTLKLPIRRKDLQHDLSKDKPSEVLYPSFVAKQDSHDTANKRLLGKIINKESGKRIGAQFLSNDWGKLKFEDIKKMIRKSKDNIEGLGLKKSSSKALKLVQAENLHARNKSSGSGGGSVTRRSKKNCPETDSIDHEFQMRRGTPQKSKEPVTQSSSSIMNLIKLELAKGSRQFRTASQLASATKHPTTKNKASKKKLLGHV
jgi:hypothetical protein